MFGGSFGCRLFHFPPPRRLRFSWPLVLMGKFLIKKPSTFVKIRIFFRKLIATAHGDHCVYVCDILHGRVIHRLAGHPRSPWALAFHPSRSDLLASGCLGGEVRVWDLKVRIPNIYFKKISSSSFFKTGCSESLHLDNEDAMVPGTSSNAEGPTVYTASVAIASVAFHPDERLLAIAAGDRLIFWDWSSKYPRAECRTATPRERVR